MLARNVDGAAHIGMKRRIVIDKQNALVGGFIDGCIADDTLVIFSVAFVTLSTANRRVPYDLCSLGYTKCP